MLARIRKLMQDKDQGFTLIELRVVMIIIGIPAAIALPLYLNQRTKGYEATAKSDPQAIATATNVVSALTTVINATNALNSNVSANDQVNIYVDASGNNYCVSVKNFQGANAWGLTAAGGLTSGVNRCSSPTAIS